MRGAFGSPVLRGATRSHAAANALGDALPRLVGPALASASAHAATAHLIDRFLMDYFPRPLEGGPPLLPYARRPPRAPARSVPLAAPQRSRPPGAGSGTQGALYLDHGAPSCARCRSLGWGISRCRRAGHEGHAGSSGGPGCPIAPRRVARCSSPRPDARGRPRCPLGLDGPARPPRPSRARALRPPADARPRPEFWALALPPRWGPTPPSA